MTRLSVFSNMPSTSPLVAVLEIMKICANVTKIRQGGKMKILKPIKNILSIIIICLCLTFWWQISASYGGNVYNPHNLDAYRTLIIGIKHFLYWFLISFACVGTSFLFYKFLFCSPLTVKKHLDDSFKGYKNKNKGKTQLLRLIKNVLCIVVICIWLFFLWFFMLKGAGKRISNIILQYHSVKETMQWGIVMFLHGIVIVTTALVTFWLMYKFIKEE